MFHKAKFDITGTKLVDDDSELTDKYGETNTNPYVDKTDNNEAENFNTKTVERGDKLVTTKYGWIQLNLMQLTKTTSKQ